MTASDPQIVFSNAKFKRWKARIEANGNRLEDIQVLSVISRSGCDLYGAFLDCQLTTPEHQRMRRCVLIRGDCVVIVPVLTCRDDGVIYTLLVEQRRIIDGDFSQEFPAGMLDLQMDDPRIMASKELREELHMDVAPQEIKPLADQPIKVISSLIGDLLFYYYFEKEVTRAFLKAMDGRPTGCHSEAEYIRVRIHEMAHIANNFLSPALIGVKLLERVLKRTF